MAIDKSDNVSDGLADEAQVADRNKRLRMTEADRKEVIKTLMSTEVGRRWIYELLGECHCFHASPPTDALRMAFDEGERNVGMRLMAAILGAAPERYLEMLTEQKNG